MTYEYEHSNEKLSVSPEFSTPVSRWRKLIALVQDPDCRAGLGALYRTGANTAIGAIDTLSLPGEIASIIPDGIKVLRGFCRRFGVDPKILDLTPDVEWWVALPTEALEIPTGAHAPTHWIEGSIQFFKYDRARISQARKAFYDISSFKTQEELRLYIESKRPQIKVVPISDLSTSEIMEYIPQPLF